MDFGQESENCKGGLQPPTKPDMTWRLTVIPRYNTYLRYIHKIEDTGVHVLKSE